VKCKSQLTAEIVCSDLCDLGLGTTCERAPVFLFLFLLVTLFSVCLCLPPLLQLSLFSRILLALCQWYSSCLQSILSTAQCAHNKPYASVKLSENEEAFWQLLLRTWKPGDRWRILALLSNQQKQQPRSSPCLGECILYIPPFHSFRISFG
jgi:hypothetical protein